MSLQGKVAIVTGAARGLGRAYALRLAGLGADVAIIDVDLDGAAKYGESLSAPSVSAEISALGRKSAGIKADLAKRSDATAAIQSVLAEFGRVDILVNNAAGPITPPGSSTPSVVSHQDIRLTFDVNLMSTIYCCQPPCRP
jgi:NAD(P)-dependent dehydrogenase (short-subunit alcohol dehydrogenase family)